MKILPNGLPGGACKPQIDYPCSWQYTIIGEGKTEMRKAVEQYVTEKDWTLADSNVSRSGRYVSLKLEVIVTSEERRLELYNLLAGHPAVRVVL